VWQTENESGKKQTVLSTIHSRWLFAGLSAVMAIAAVTYALGFTWQKQGDQRWQRLIIFDRLVRLPSQNTKPDKSFYQLQLNNLYHHDPDLWTRYFRQEGIDSEERLQSLLALARLDPGFFVKVVDFSLLDQGQAGILLFATMETFAKYRMVDNVLLLDYWRQQNLAKQLFNLGESSFQAGQIQQAAEFYQAAFLLNKYIFYDYRPAFLATSDWRAWLELVLLLPNLSPDNSGDFYRYMELVKQSAGELFKEEDFVVLRQLLEQVFRLDSSDKYYLFHHLVLLDMHHQELEQLYLDFDF
jgi:tetratricopeptide (TPR) repeat protein